jgi:capsular polysaccharide biosynthesis protein
LAVEVETTGQLQEFLGLIRRRKWQVILPLAVVLSLGIFFAVVTPKRYVVKTQVELRPVSISVSSKEAANAPFQIKSRQRIRKVAVELENREFLALPPVEQEDWLEDAQDDVKVTVVEAARQSTSFVNIEYSHVEVDWAVDFLGALRDDWTTDVVEGDRRKVDDELARLRALRDRIEQEYRESEQDLTEIMRIHGLSATQPVPGADAARNEDPAFERLRRNEILLESTESEIEEAEVLLAEMGSRLAEMPALVDLAAEVVGGLSNDADIADLELQIAELKDRIKGLKPANPRYQVLQDEIVSLEGRRTQMLRLSSKGEVQQRSQPNPAIRPLRERIEATRADLRVLEARRDRLRTEITEDQGRVAELHPVYSEVRAKKEAISRLAASLHSAEAAYQAKSRELDLLNSPLANPFEITQEVARPSKPTEPNPILIVSFGLIAGLAIGLLVAVLGEYTQNCFRSMADVARVMAVPVLGTVQRIVTRREARLVLARRVSVGAASAAVVAAVLFVTWAWAYDSALLSQDLRDAIEGLRAQLK